MDSTLTEALLKRERLLARIDQQRMGIQAASAGLARPAAVIDRMLDGARFLRSHPLVVASLALAVLALRARSLVGIAARGIGIWRLVRRVQRLTRYFGR